MVATLDRRRLLLGGGLAMAAGPAVMRGAWAQAAGTPLKIGLITIKTGPLASGGIAMEQGMALYLKQQNNVLSGRPTTLIVADTGGQAAQAKPKAQELVERDKADFIVGPLAAYEALAISDYIRQTKVPVLSFAAAEDLTQRKLNPYFIRTADSAAQCAHPLADYAAKKGKYKRIATIADDFAFGYEQVGGFQRVFEDNGGKIVKKLWSPINTADYAPYLAQLGDVDAIFIGFAGVNGLKFIRQYADFGGKIPLLAGQAALDETQLQQMGDAALGIVSCAYYTSVVDTPSNRQMIADMKKLYNSEPGGYSVGTYVAGQFIDAALKTTGGKTDDRDALIKALRAVSLTDTPRGPIHLDDYGNAVSNVYICEVKRLNGRLVNTLIETVPNVSQFWTYDPKWYIAQPVYSRDYPVSRYLEK